MVISCSDILRNSKFFRQVTGASFDRLVSMAVLKRYERKQLIFSQHEACPGLFVVGIGLVRIFNLSPSGKEHVLHLVSPGGTFAEVAAIGGFDCPAFAEALEDSQCALLPLSPLLRALKDDHQLCLNLMLSMAGWVKHLVGLLEDITLRDAMGRVARYILDKAEKESGKVALPSLKKHMASQLNLTSETLSRTLRRLDEDGMINLAGSGGIMITNRKVLEQAAEGLLPLL